MVLKWDDNAKNKIKEALIRGAMSTAEEVLSESLILVPRDTGTLGNSGTITVDKLPDPSTAYNEAKVKALDSDTDYSPDIDTIYISYNTPYANKQHEDLQLNHPNGGEAKFLEKAWNRKGGAKRIRKNITVESKKMGLL